MCPFLPETVIFTGSLAQIAQIYCASILGESSFTDSGMTLSEFLDFNELNEYSIEDNSDD